MSECRKKPKKTASGSAKAKAERGAEHAVRASILDRASRSLETACDRESRRTVFFPTAISRRILTSAL
jgi:hypothetical protein